MLFTLALLLLTPNIDVHATQAGHEQGDIDTEGVQGEGVVEGASRRRTGFIIWASDGDGNKKSDVVFVPTYGNSISWRETSTHIDRLINISKSGINRKILDNPVPWSSGPFDEDVKSAMDGFVMSPYGEYESGGEWILFHYLGMSETEVDDFMEIDEPHLNIESVMTAGIYEQSHFTGYVITTTARGWASVTEKDNYLNKYTHGNLPNSLHLVEPWMNLRVVTNPSGMHKSSEILAQPYLGYGLASYRLVPAENQVVKVYTSGGGVVDDTIYTSCSKNYKIEQDGDYKVKRWSVGADKTTVTGKQPYNAVTSGVSLTRTGTAPAEIQLTSQEKAIFIEYEKEQTDPLPPPSNNSEALRAYEVNYPYPKMVGVVSRTDTGALPADYDFNTGFQNRKNSMNSRDDIKDYQEATSDFTVHENFSGALSGLNISQLHLYHTGVGKYKP